MRRQAAANHVTGKEQHTMKQIIWIVVTAGLLAGGTTLEAREHRSDRPKSPERATDAGGARVNVLLASHEVPQIGAPAEAPPPAPGIPGPGVIVPPPPMPPVGGPMTPLTAVPIVPQGEPVPGPGPGVFGGPPLALAPAVVLYRGVKYKDRHRIAPGAVPMCVAVRDPCADKHCNACSGPPTCVLVEICVPPCPCTKITCRHDGTKVRYDYGQYAVNITSRHGLIVVKYDD
jgi:hypothetical protein